MKCCAESGRLSAIVAAAASSVIIMAAATQHVDTEQTLVAEDRISGEWEGLATGDAFPEDLELSASLEMDDDGAVVGIFTTVDGDIPFAGAFAAETNKLTGAVTPEGANWELTLTLDEDTLEGDAEETFSGVKAKVTLERVID